MKSPPAGVKLVMEAVCVMNQVSGEKVADPDNPGQKKIDFWKPAQKMLGDMKFLDNLKAYDKDNIPVVVMKKIRDTFKDDPEFVPDKVITTCGIVTPFSVMLLSFYYPFYYDVTNPSTITLLTPLL